MTLKLNILVVDDDWTVRESLKNYLSRHNMCTWEADNRAAVDALGDPSIFDVAILDIVLPEKQGERVDFRQHQGLNIARDLRSRNPRLGIIFLSAYMDRGPEVIELFMEGHDRIVYLLKGSPPKELLSAIEKVAMGSGGLEIASGINTQQTTLFTAALATLTVEEREILVRALERLPILTQPEWRVLELLGACMTRQDAANHLTLVVRTIDFHVGNIYEKLLLRETKLNQAALLIKLYLLFALQKTTKSA